MCRIFGLSNMKDLLSFIKYNKSFRKCFYESISFYCLWLHPGIHPYAGRIVAGRPKTGDPALGRRPQDTDSPMVPGYRYLREKASNRSDFQQMISLAKEAAHPDYILTWKFSRFARNQEESIVYKSLLRKNNVQVISVSEPLPDGPFSSLIERIIEWMDEYYSIRLSGEVRRGMMEKALSGGYQSPPPLGYQKPPGTSIPQVYEPEAAIYRQIKEYALAGRSPTSIARLLNSQGLRTKRGHAFDSRSIRYICKSLLCRESTLDAGCFFRRSV